MIVFDYDVSPMLLIFLLEEVLRFALGVHIIYANNRHLHMPDVEGHSHMSRLSKHGMSSLKVIRQK